MIAYTSPYVPAEWIAAHCLRPQWLRLRATPGQPSMAVMRGICPFAGAMIDAAISGVEASALVLTTVCDQMRYAAAAIQSRCDCPVFLLNVPSTWQSNTVKTYFLDELLRLGRFLEKLGGKSPDANFLTRTMIDYDSARRAVIAVGGKLSARHFADVVAEVRGTLTSKSCAASETPPINSNGIPLAVLGGPLLESDYELFDIIEQSGGRVVLDATEGGERTLPRPFDSERIASDPLCELADAYFGTIPDMFRRPNDKLYEWLGRELDARRVHGIILRRYVWCDLWHGEATRIKQWSPVPVLDLDAGSDDTFAANRMQGRIEAFMEMLK